MPNIKDQLIRYMDAGFPILYLETFEETKADAMIHSIAAGKNIVEWSINGFFDYGESAYMDWDLIQTLAYMVANPKDFERTVFVVKDAHQFLDDPAIKAELKHLALKINEGLEEFTIILLSPIVNLPKELENFTTLFTMGYLSPADIKDVIQSFCREQELDPLHETLLNDLVQTFKGLSESEIRGILALALSDNGEITRSDLSLIFDQKQQVIKKSGILEMIPLKESLEDIGGLESLKKWLKRKAKVFKNMPQAEAFGVDVPKGVLIAGMPGCGKSLNAKAAAKLFEVPLLRLDMGRLMGKYVGESEANMRKAIALAEAISPCVLWIDELEKAFAGIGGEGGGADVTTRLFGTFLTWLQEKDSMAFVVATANNIVKMPPELLRKGRFDEIFYVDLPTEAERKKIFSIHIGKRRPADLESIDIAKLARETNGYSGADIEGVVRDSVEDAFADGKDKLSTEDIQKAIKQTHSLSEIMKDSLEEMAKAYKDRKFKNASEGR